MDLNETYTLLFTDSLVSNFAINFSDELVIHSMKVFGSYNPYLMVLVASFAFLLSACVNYVFGILCYNILKPFQPEEEGASKINPERVRSHKYLILILMLSAVPFFGKFVMLFAGFCRVPPLLTISIGSASRLIYYSILMLV
jgi:membrane protein YqaA with SNARE-associated domain